MDKPAIVLLNLGSPASTSVPDVRRYLRQFLSDERVLDAPAPIRWMVLNLFILPFRPKKSAEAYRRIWTEEGSPLIVTSRRQQELLKAQVDAPILLGMRYGDPSTDRVVAELKAMQATRVFIIPLYPHYAMSSYETAVVAMTEAMARQGLNIPYTIKEPFYAQPGYLDALLQRTADMRAEAYDYWLFSFHGIPERHLRKGDPSHAHCLTCDNCCEVAHPAHASCYRHQCLETAKAFAAQANLPEGKWGVSFQSRLGRDPWLTPYTDATLEKLGEQGIKRVMVMCPAFITDCLETLEEIALEGAEEFKEAGGEQLTLVPCLNDHPAWIDLLATWSNAWVNDFTPPPRSPLARLEAE